MKASIRFQRQRQPLDKTRNRAQAQFASSARSLSASSLNPGSSNFRFDPSAIANRRSFSMDLATSAVLTGAKPPAAFVERPPLLPIPTDRGGVSPGALTLRWLVKAPARSASDARK
ncbi:hypothetical protein CR492_00220 [Methylocella silvestris]|uniref:Uncharacterized protein n=1 Tax=Methylocella silvestris TaxID=199596 RepID=A0A2J7TKW6_METSI|nr:hypothetical protein CR492_00220 [Methylocella silvestris]